MITIRASGANGWMNCYMSARVAAQAGALPDDETDAAREGTCAAWVAETVINGDADHCDDLIDKTHPNGWVVDDEMSRHVQPYVDMILSRQDPRAEVYRESVYGSVKVAGTLDAESWDGDTLCIDDLKYGWQIIEPTSWQLRAYMALYLWELWNKHDGSRKPNAIRLGIYQPRPVHAEGIYRTVTVSMIEAVEYATAINNRVIDFNAGADTATPGSHCDHCQGAAICAALTQSIYAMWQPVSDRTVAVPTNQQLSDELDMLDRMEKLLKARTAAVQAEAEFRMDNQQVVPGWAKMPKSGKRKFTVDGDTIKVLTGIDPYEKPKLCTPAELERRGAPAPVVKQLSVTPTVGHKLSRVDEKTVASLFEKGRK